MTLEMERVMVHVVDLWRRSLFCGCLSRVHSIQTEDVSGRSREHRVQHLVFGSQPTSHSISPHSGLMVTDRLFWKGISLSITS